MKAKLQSCMKKMNSLGMTSAPLQPATTPVIQMKSMSNLAAIGKQLSKQFSVESESGGLLNSGVRKAQPSMGVMAASLKSRRNIRDVEKMSSEDLATPLNDNQSKRYHLYHLPASHK